MFAFLQEFQKTTQIELFLEWIVSATLILRFFCDFLLEVQLGFSGTK